MSRVLLVLFMIGFLAGPAFAQKSAHAKRPALQGNCKTCHACDQPTKANPCLVACPKHEFGIVRRTVAEGPNMITLSSLTNSSGKRVYPPVRFSHQTHAEMADLGGGCALCHHYNPAGRIQSCDQCHEPNRKDKELHRPDLKAAYHRQCMDCHRSWSHSSDCKQCHAQDTRSKDRSTQAVHPQVTVPDRVIKTTSYQKGRVITFNHTQHINLYRLDCTSCHSNESCVRCHDVNPPATQVSRSLDEMHRPCAKCHATKSTCSFCHADSPQPAFDHGRRTGWSLSAPHQRLQCQACHKTRGTFSGLKRDCRTCHKNWDASTFKHEVTGLVLDEIHTALSCTDCHVNGDYSKRMCSGCHDDKSYPKYLPGRKVSRKSAPSRSPGKMVR